MRKIFLLVEEDGDGTKSLYDGFVDSDYVEIYRSEYSTDWTEPGSFAGGITLKGDTVVLSLEDKEIELDYDEIETFAKLYDLFNNNLKGKFKPTNVIKVELK